MSSERPLPPPRLVVAALSAGFQNRTVLDEVSFAVPARGVFGVMGPAGVGKSTLLRTLARWNEPLPSFWLKGDVLYDGRSLLREMSLEEAQREVTLLAQKAQLYTATVLDNAIAELRPSVPIDLDRKRELAQQALAPLDLWAELEPLLAEPVLALTLGQQRRLSLARLASGGARVLLADEPLRDLPDDEVARLKGMLQQLGRERALVLVTHNQREARELCDDIVLLAAGRVIEVGRAADFFSAPKTAAGADFVRYGNCWPQPVAAEDAVEEGEEEPPEELTAARPRDLAPRTSNVGWPGGFHWVLPNLLGGMQRPGLLRPLADDLEALHALGCKVLVNLTRRAPDVAGLAAYGIESHHQPIVDMSVPTLEQAYELCRRIEDWVGRGLPTVVHCKAGLGRTGTILACCLVLRGENSVRAVQRVRASNPAAIQTPEQLAFVSQFADDLQARREAGQAAAHGA